MMPRAMAAHNALGLDSSAKSVDDRIPYSNEALQQDLLRVRTAWEECQRSRARNAIYNYLTAVSDLVAWWAAEHRDVERARRALRLAILQRLIKADEPFTAIIFGTSDQDKVDRPTRSKWSRVLRYAAQFKSQSEPLGEFVRRKGGVNRCAARFTRRLGRHGKKMKADSCVL